MDFSINSNELISFGLKRLSLEQVDASLNCLNTDKNNYNESVHSARKNFKKIRTILRLVRYKIGEDDFKFDNYFYRDLGRRLSELRDSLVLIETLDMLSAKNKNEFSSIRKILEENYQNIYKAKFGELNEFKIISSELNEAKGRIYDWGFHGENFDIIYEGLKNIYSKGKFQMLLAVNQPTPENFHEWRKKTKYLWYSVRILMNCWFNHLSALAESLKRLSDILGDLNDLNELKKIVAINPDSFSKEKENDILFDLIDKKADQLKYEARYLGERIYLEDPPEFANRFRSYYQIWKCEKIIS